MRDLVVTLIIVGSLPFILLRPHIGILVWSWIAYMNPHRLTWGFAYNMPFAMMVGVTTLISFVLNPSQRRAMPFDGLVVLLFIWVIWINVTTLFALAPTEAWELWDKVMKIQLMNFVLLMLIFGRERILALVTVITFSIAFFGIKGGVFTITTGANFMVLGPTGSFITGNTEISLALVVVLPLLIYLRSLQQNRWMRHLFMVFIILCGLSILGSFSRGAFLAAAMMVGFLWLKSTYKLATMVGLLVLIPMLLAFMPDKWFDRMATIENYQQDESAMGRLNAWGFAWNLATDKDHFLIGGGLGTFQPEYFHKWAPDPEAYHDAHSIYFEVLGEQGWVGLAIFLMLLWFTWRGSSKIIRETKNHEDLSWMGNLAKMIQVSLVGYMTGGAFLGLAYWDLPYNIMALVILLKREVREALAEKTAQATGPGKRQAEMAPSRVPRFGPRKALKAR